MLHVRLWRKAGEQSGFTLVELLGVVLIIIVLSLIAIPVYAEVTDTAREAKSLEELRAVEEMIEAYYTQHGYYPMNLGSIAKDVRQDDLFKSPWSTARRPVYYFYWVDRAGEDAARSYVLGLPNPEILCEEGLTHCGREPWAQTWYGAEVDPDALNRSDRLLHIRKNR